MALIMKTCEPSCTDMMKAYIQWTNMQSIHHTYVFVLDSSGGSRPRSISAFWRSYRAAAIPEMHHHCHHYQLQKIGSLRGCGDCHRVACPPKSVFVHADWHLVSRRSSFAPEHLESKGKRKNYRVAFSYIVTICSREKDV